MGKEARAACRFGDGSGMVTATLEGDVLLVRGDVRATIARNTIREVAVVGTELRFLAGDVPVALSLGSIAARRWATALVDGPPDLAKKLGITETTRVRLYGSFDDEALQRALEVAASRLETAPGSGELATLVFIRANGARELEAALAIHLASEERAVPLWVVYRKGKDVPLNEAGVRAAVRARKLVDTKIAGVSPALSALRFSPHASATSEAAEPTIGVAPARPLGPATRPRPSGATPGLARSRQRPPR